MQLKLFSEELDINCVIITGNCGIKIIKGRFID